MDFKKVNSTVKEYSTKNIWSYILMNIILKGLVLFVFSLFLLWSLSPLISGASFFITMEELGISSSDPNSVYSIFVSIVMIYCLINVLNFILSVVNYSITLAIHRSIKSRKALTIESPFSILTSQGLKLILLSLTMTIIIGFVWWVPFLPLVIGYAGSFTIMLMDDEGLDILEAFKESCKRTKGHKWHLFKINFVYNLIITIALLAFYIVLSSVGHLIVGLVLSIIVFFIFIGVTMHYSLRIYALTPIYYNKLISENLESSLAQEEEDPDFTGSNDN